MVRPKSNQRWPSRPKGQSRTYRNAAQTMRSARTQRSCLIRISSAVEGLDSPKREQGQDRRDDPMSWVWLTWQGNLNSHVSNEPGKDARDYRLRRRRATALRPTLDVRVGWACCPPRLTLSAATHRFTRVRPSPCPRSTRLLCVSPGVRSLLAMDSTWGMRVTTRQMEALNNAAGLPPGPMRADVNA